MNSTLSPSSLCRQNWTITILRRRERSHARSGTPCSSWSTRSPPSTAPAFMLSGTSNSSSLHHWIITILQCRERLTVSIYVLASEGTLLRLHHPIAVGFLHHESLKIGVIEIAVPNFMFDGGRITSKVKESMPSSLLPLLYTWLFPKPTPSLPCLTSPANPRPSVPHAMCRSGCHCHFHRLRWRPRWWRREC